MGLADINKHFSLKLSHMGLILLGIPALFEILFVLIMFFLLQQAELEIKKESRSKEVIAHAHSLQQHITNAGISIGAYGFSKSALPKAAFEAAVRGIKREMKDLSVLLGSDSAQMKRLHLLSESVSGALASIEESRKVVEQAPVISLLADNKRLTDNLDKLSGMVGVLQKQIDDLVSSERQLTKDLPAKRQRSKIAIMAALSIGASANIALAIALALFFQRTVSQRQLVLMDNAKRLSRAQVLNSPLEGKDEIAELDRVFHKMAQELAAADEFKKELVAMVSHELRSPLSSVDAILSFLEAGGMGELPDGVRRRLLTAEGEVQRLISLINDLLDIEKMEAGKFEMRLVACSLQNVFERSSLSVSGALEKAGLSLSIEPCSDFVLADSDRLIQVMVNLISNAIKFSPESSVIKVEAKANLEFVEISVIDQGKGISEEFKKRIFERFSQMESGASSGNAGSGLGLAICRAIVLQHKGKIGVDSEEGRGSRFWFSIPRAEKMA